MIQTVLAGLGFISCVFGFSAIIGAGLTCGHMFARWFFK